MHLELLGRDSRRDDRTKPRPLHLQPRIRSFTHGLDLTPDMFTLAITIRPDHEQVGVSSELLEVSFDAIEFLMIEAIQRDSILLKCGKRPPHLVNKRDGLRIKQIKRIAARPSLVVVREIHRHQVTQHGRDGEFSLSPTRRCAERWR